MIDAELPVYNSFLRCDETGGAGAFCGAESCW